MLMRQFEVSLMWVWNFDKQITTTMCYEHISDEAINELYQGR